MDKKHSTSKTAKTSRTSPRTQLPSQSNNLSYNTSLRRNTSSRAVDDSKSNNESMREDSSILEESYDNGNILENRSQKESAELLALKRENEALMERLKLAEQDKKKAQDSESKLNFKVTALEQEKQEAKADLTKTKSILQIVQTSNNNLLQEMEKLKSATSTAKSFAELEKLKREKDELTPKNDNLRREIVSFQSAKSSLEKEEKKLKENVQELRQQKEEVSKDLSNLKSELEKLKTSHSTAMEKNAKSDVESIRILTLSLKEESAKLETENKQLLVKIEEIGKERDAAKDETGILTRQLGEFKAIIARNLQEMKELNSQIASMTKKEDVEKLVKERDELKVKSEKFRKEVEDLKKYKVASQMEVAYLKGKVTELEKAKEEAQANLVKAKNASQIHQVNNSNLMQEIEKLKLVKSPTASFSEMDNLRRERDDLSYKIVVLKKDTDTIKNEKLFLESERKQLKDRVQELEQKKEEVSVDLGRLKIEYERLQASNTHSIQELDRMTSQLSVAQKDDSDSLSNRDKTEVKDDTESLRLLTSSLENEKTKLEAENTQLRERVDKLEQQKEEVSIEMVKATNHLDDAKAKIAQKLQEVEELQYQINIMVSKEEADILRKERDALNQTNDGLKKDANAIKKEKDSLALRLVNLEEKVQKLEKKKEEMKSIFVAQCEKVFALLNLNGTEAIKKAEFTEIVKGCALISTDEEINAQFQGLDSDKNEAITLTNFLKVVTDDETRPKYMQLIESVLRKEKDIITFKNRKNNSDRQPKSSASPAITLDTIQGEWVERSRDIEVKPKEAEKTIKLKAFLANRDDLQVVCKTEESEPTPLFLNSPTTADSLLAQERLMKSQTPTNLAGGITWQSRLEKSEILGSQTPSVQTRGRGTRLFGDSGEKVKRTSSEEPRQFNKLKAPDRGQRLDQRVEEFFKALGNSKVDAQTKMELKMCLQDLPDRELFKMNSLARSERIAFLSYVIERFKIQSKMGAQGAQKVENLEKVLEKERNQLVVEQEEIRKLRIMGLVGFNPLMANFNAMFDSTPKKGTQPKH